MLDSSLVRGSQGYTRKYKLTKINFLKVVQKCTTFDVFAPIVERSFFMQEISTFVKLHRSMTKWRWYQDANTFRVFVHLIIKANVYDKDFQTITVHRGQLVTSYAHLAEELGFIKNKKVLIQPIRTALNHLKSTGEVTVEKFPKGLIITVNNYDEYQKVTRNSTSNQHSTNMELTFNQQQYKKDKNIKNVKKEREDTPTQTEKQIFGEFKNVFLTETEVANLKQKYPNDYVNKIEKLSAYIASTGKEYNSHYAVLLQWLAEDLAKAQQGGGKSDGNQSGYVQGYQRSYVPNQSRLQQERSYNLEALENEDYESYLDNLIAGIG